MINYLKKILIVVSLILSLFTSCIALLTRNVPEDEYTEKLNLIKPIDQKDQDLELLNWSFNLLESKNLNIIHKYYYYPSNKKNAEVLVFLPGINIDGRIFLHLKDLSQYYELIVYEFSETSPLYQGELDDFVIILRDFLKELSLEQFNLVGTSFGGIISIRFYAQNKRDNINLNINKLILISTSIIGTTKKDIRRSIKTVKIMKKLPDYKLYFIIEKIAGRIKIPEETDIYPPLSEIITIRDINWYRQSTYASENYNAGPDAQEIDCPVLVLMGSEDELVDWKETKERAEEYIKQARIKIIDGASHLMVYLNAREVVQSIHQFIENTPLDEG